MKKININEIPTLPNDVGMSNNTRSDATILFPAVIVIGITNGNKNRG